MFCPNCGANAGAARFCPNCGGPLSGAPDVDEREPSAPRRPRSVAVIAFAGLAAAIALALAVGALLFLRSNPKAQSTAGVSQESPSNTIARSTPTSTATPTASTSTTPSIGLQDVRSLAAGLFCRDLNAQGYSYAAAVDYWRAHGQPNQMDADANGVPCETVYPSSDVAAYWGARSSPFSPSPTPAQPSPAAQPRGTLLVMAGPEGGFGQTFPEGRCAVWRTGFVNQSDTAIDQITVAPPSGEYTNFSGWNGKDFPTRPARPPAPAILNVYLKPGDDVALEYKTCTTTPPPANPNFEYGAAAPKTVAFRWVTGVSGRACFKC